METPEEEEIGVGFLPARTPAFFPSGHRAFDINSLL
jgi:hypothetical protein